MALNIAATATLQVGQPLVVDASSPDGRYAVVFEDDGDTGFFYAVDTDADDSPVQDALRIYTVANVTDANLPSTLEIGWSDDGLKALLLINDHPHAAFDFAARQGFCQAGEPAGASSSGWSPASRAWREDIDSWFD